MIFRLSCLVAILFCCGRVASQPVLFSDPVTARVFNSEKYSGFRGSPFLQDDWTPGTVITTKGTYPNLKLRLDAYSNILYFEKDEKAYELADEIKRFYLTPFPADTAFQRWYTKGLTGNGLKPEQYVQILEEGRIAFYKSEIRQLTEMSEINAGMVKTFKPAIRYYVVRNGSAELVKLSPKEIMPLFADKETQLTAFINEHKLSLKREQDVTAAIAYYNSL